MRLRPTMASPFFAPYFLRILTISVLCCCGFYANAQNGASPPVVYEKEIKKKSGALDSIKSEIDKRRKKIRELEKAEGGFLARLDYLESNIEASKQYLAMLASRIDTAETAIVMLTDSLHRARSLLADRQFVMKERLRRAYMAGMVSPVTVLLLSQSPLDLIHRARYLEEVNRYDRELIGRIDYARQIFDSKKQAVEAERAKLATLLSAKEKEQVMLLKEEASRRAILSDIRVKKRSNQSVMADLEESQRELNRIIRILEQKRAKSTADIRRKPGSTAVFALQKGRLPWPLHGTITNLFGKIVHPVYKTVTMNNGIDIQAEAGEPVVCVAAGTVIYTGSMRGLGMLVIVDHGAGFLTIYANLGEFAVTAGQVITAGASIGRAGKGDNGTPQMHFEIRKSTDALDPALWLERKR